eukprot:2493889-Pleurochrysis_carterae.AAC.2
MLIKVNALVACSELVRLSEKSDANKSTCVCRLLWASSSVRTEAGCKQFCKLWCVSLKLSRFMLAVS